jgi:hypothetical protein
MGMAKLQRRLTIITSKLPARGQRSGLIRFQTSGIVFLNLEGESKRGDPKGEDGEDIDKQVYAEV